MKLKLIFLVSSFVSLILFPGPALSQTLDSDTLLNKLDLYSKSHRKGILFVHTDKTVYTNNETIWFSAYLVNNTAGALKDHSIFSFALMRDDNRQVVFQEKFVMQNGLSFGSAALPDSIPPGNYQFIASTNVLDENGRPYALFSQPLTIKSITENSFTASLALLDTNASDRSVRAKITFAPKDPRSKEKAAVEFSVGNAASKAVSLKENSAIITLTSSEIKEDDPVLLTSIKYANEVRYLSLTLPKYEARGSESQGIKVRFFPEGGSLSEGLESTVAWEAVSSTGTPLVVSAVLYQDDRPIDTLNTSSYGVGSFKIKPTGKSRYFLKPGAQGTVFNLPKVIDNNIVLQLSRAVINDTLRLNLRSLQGIKVRLLVHNFRQAYASFDLAAKPGDNRLSILLPSISKGLATITVLDEQGRPLAERLFFAHYDQKLAAAIEPSKTEYRKRESVNLKVKLADQHGHPAGGVVSLAVVQDNRIEGGKEQDMESYVYLNHALGRLPRDPRGRGISNKNYLEDILLVKGWRRYTWQDLLAASAKDTAQSRQIPVFKANVYYNNKPLKKSTLVYMRKDSLSDVIETEADGSFILSADRLRITEGRKIVLSSYEKFKEGYTFKTTDPFTEVNRRIAKELEVMRTGIATDMQTTDGQQLTGMEKTNILQEVVVKADKANDFLFGVPPKGPPGINACGDYLCRNGILNCLVHPLDPEGSQPIIGVEYMAGNGSKRLYTGCLNLKKGEAIFEIAGIYMAREFYGAENELAVASTPLYLSTLFWKPGIIINEKGEANFSFSTADITGGFRIILQGIGKENIIYGESSFTVKAN